MVSHVEHFFMCLLFIFMYSWGKHLGFPPNFNQRNQGNNPFTITSKRIKCLRISLSKGSKILYLENYKTLKKEIEDNTNIWKDMSSWTGRINIFKMTILPKEIPIKTPF